MSISFFVIPAKAGTQIVGSREGAKDSEGLGALLCAFAPSREMIFAWVPAFAGMTIVRGDA